MPGSAGWLPFLGAPGAYASLHSLQSVPFRLLEKKKKEKKKIKIYSQNSRRVIER